MGPLGSYHTFGETKRENGLFTVGRRDRDPGTSPEVVWTGVTGHRSCFSGS